ncbi:peptide deformylase [Synechococcus sp. CBW1107]|uniref:peptide deformylase n=1 Tax=Synechococcus sp. CBW1107 TaxID=2789857 RepID=UPI0018CE1B30|nr:peptide deformylase [Synechococcus sp. CBW1107]QPN56733.1 peptide deformylase [Synechococcus sp. CBW1107]
MTQRTVLRLGDPRLRQVSRPVERFGTPELHALITDLRDTMAACAGAGLAAPQIAVPLRVVIFGITVNPRYPEAPPIPETVLINPEITPIDRDRASGWEGCLSVPGLRGQVSRWRRILYRGFDAEGHPIERSVDGFHARVVQHECDHLDGVLFPDRLVDSRSLGFTEELEASGLLPVAGPLAPASPEHTLDRMRQQLERHSALEDLGPLFGPKAQGLAPGRDPS